MAAEWRAARIEDVADRVAMGPFGSSIKVDTFVPSGVPIVSGQHLHSFKVDGRAGFNFITEKHADRLKRANVQRGDVIFTHAGNIGQVAYIPEDSDYNRYVISQRQFYMRCDRSKVIPEYVVAYFKTPEGQHQLLANASQVGVPSIAQPVTYLRTIEIPLPPLSEQRAIAHVLGTLDDKIELNRRTIETLEAMARALFKSWFVDFDPVRAKAEGRDPGLPKPLADLFPDSFEDTERGEIPSGWRLRIFGNLLTDSIGGDWGKDAPGEIHGEPIAVIRGTDIPNLESGGVGKVPVRYTTRKKLDKRRLVDGDIIIEVSGGSPTQPTGRSLFVSQQLLDRFSTDVVCASFCRRLRPATRAAGIVGSQHLSWLYHTGGTWGYQNQSTGIANFQTTRFLESELVVWPDMPLLDMYTHVVDRMLRKRSLNEALTLARLRDALLPKLLSGELRVRDDLNRRS